MVIESNIRSKYSNFDKIFFTQNNVSLHLQLGFDIVSTFIIVVHKVETVSLGYLKLLSESLGNV